MSVYVCYLSEPSSAVYVNVSKVPRNLRRFRCKYRQMYNVASSVASRPLSYRSSYTAADDNDDDVRRNKYRGEWLADNVTGTEAASTASGGSVEYRVNRKNLRLRNGPDDGRKHLALSAYAANRMGRGPHTYFGSDNVMLLRHPWWWRGESTYESSTKVAGPAGTSSTGTFFFVSIVSFLFNILVGPRDRVSLATIISHHQPLVIRIPENVLVIPGQ
ncbi:hypothetical protein QTP88_007290 [Uroleucon formosanum]